jgi:nitrite reductase (NADH) small subunit
MSGATQTRFVVGEVTDLPPGSMTIVRPDDGPGIGVFNVAGEFYALRNHCPHMGAPLCRGVVNGTSTPTARPSGEFEPTWGRDGEIITCPWHHWEFDIRTGRTVFPSKSRARTYEVEVQEAPDVLERLRRGVETVPVEVDGAAVVLLLS